MAEKETKAKDSEDANLSIPEQVREAISGAARLLGVAVTELWSIFVRQYIVRGISEAFFGIVIFSTAVYLQGYIGLWWLLAAAPSMILFYGAIQNLGNPKYYAIEDIIKKVKTFKKEDGVKIVKDSFKNYY